MTLKMYKLNFITIFISGYYPLLKILYVRYYILSQFKKIDT